MPAAVGIDFSKRIFALNIRQEKTVQAPVPPLVNAGADPEGRRQVTPSRLRVQNGHGDLPEMIAALQRPAGLPRGVDRRE